MKKTMRQVAIEVKKMFPETYVAVHHEINKYSSGNEGESYRIYVENILSIEKKTLMAAFVEARDIAEVHNESRA
jgi:hypothetical protein